MAMQLTHVQGRCPWPLLRWATRKPGEGAVGRGKRVVTTQVGQGPSGHYFPALLGRVVIEPE
jgi:hypothetical protein